MPRSIYHITSAEGEIFQFDSTLSMGISFPGSVSKYATASKNNKGDHYQRGNLTASINGRVSDFNRFLAVGEWVPTSQFIEGLRAVYESGLPFSFTWRDDKPRNNDFTPGTTYTEPNCFFTGFNIGQGATAGYHSGANKHSYLIELSIEQVRSASQAGIEVAPADFIADKVDEKKTTGGSPEGDDLTDYQTKQKKDLKYGLNFTENQFRSL